MPFRPISPPDRRGIPEEGAMGGKFRLFSWVAYESMTLISSRSRCLAFLCRLSSPRICKCVVPKPRFKPGLYPLVPKASPPLLLLCSVVPSASRWAQVEAANNPSPLWPGKEVKELGLLLLLASLVVMAVVAAALALAFVPDASYSLSCRGLCAADAGQAPRAEAGEQAQPG